MTSQLWPGLDLRQIQLPWWTNECYHEEEDQLADLSRSFSFLCDQERSTSRLNLHFGRQFCAGREPRAGLRTRFLDSATSIYVKTVLLVFIDPSEPPALYRRSYRCQRYAVGGPDVSARPSKVQICRCQPQSRQHRPLYALCVSVHTGNQRTWGGWGALAPRSGWKALRWRGSGFGCTEERQRCGGVYLSCGSAVFTAMNGQKRRLYSRQEHFRRWLVVWLQIPSVVVKAVILLHPRHFSVVHLLVRVSHRRAIKKLAGKEMRDPRALQNTLTMIFFLSEPSLAVVMDQSHVPGWFAAVVIGDRGSIICRVAWWK